MNFKEFFETNGDWPIKMNSPITLNTPTPAFGAISSTGTNTTTPGNPVTPSPSTDFDLGLPSRTVTSPILDIEIMKGRQGRNWRIKLNKDTILMTTAEFRRIKGNPQKGRIATVVFQRSDKTHPLEQIQSFTVQ